MSGLIALVMCVTQVQADLTWYDPALGGINCHEPCDQMAAGHPVSAWYGRAVACPAEYPLGTVFVVRGRTPWKLGRILSHWRVQANTLAKREEVAKYE